MIPTMKSQQQGCEVMIVILFLATLACLIAPYILGQ